MGRRSFFISTVIEKINRAYWRAIIDLAAGSGIDERDWCMKNRIPINTYYTYKNMIKSSVDSREDFFGTGRSRYYEVPVNELAKCIDGAADQMKGADGTKKSIDKNENDVMDISGTDTSSDDDHKGMHRFDSDGEECLRIELGECRLYVKEGIDESILRTVIKAVMNHA